MSSVITTTPRPIVVPRGLGFALLSAAAFGSSGTFAKSLTEAGWTAGGAVLARLVVAAILMTAPGLYLMRGRWRELLGSFTQIRVVLVYGVISMAGCQLAFYLAIGHLSVGVAMLMEYLGPIMLMAWGWARTRVRPATSTLMGSAVAVAGLFVVLDVARGAQVDLIGLGWGLLAAASVASYFQIAGHAADGFPPLALTWMGLVIGGLALAAGGLVGVIPMTFSTTPVVLGGATVPFWYSVIGVACISTVLAYSTGVVGTRRLGATLASFVGLAEVLFTAIFAWLLLGQAIGPTQAAGAALMLAGVILVQNGAGSDTPDLSN